MPNKSLLVLIIVNILPIFGVLFLDWQIGSIVAIYWVENLVVGLYNVLKIIKSESLFYEKSSKNKLSKATSKLILILFFILHFWIVYIGAWRFCFFYFLGKRDKSFSAFLGVRIINIQSWRILC